MTSNVLRSAMDQETENAWAALANPAPFSVYQKPLRCLEWIQSMLGQFIPGLATELTTTQNEC